MSKYIDQQIRNFSEVIFRWMLIIIYSIIITSTILGILTIYKKIYIFIFVPLLILFIHRIWTKKEGITPKSTFRDELCEKQKYNSNIINSISLISSLLLLLLIIIPIINWPMSYTEKKINWDFGLYHLPKAVELWQTGSAWDFSISYGEYPFGYESFLSFILLFTNNISYFSIVHLTIVFLIIISVSMLSWRYLNFPSGTLLLATILVILSGFLPVYNPWYFIHYLPYTIGKNDLFLSAITIAAIIFVPFSNRKKIDWIGLGLSSGLAMSIKPNSALILLFLWGYAFYKNKLESVNYSQIYQGVGLAILGCSWIIRNLIGIGRLFSVNSMKLSKFSIWSNITNHKFYLNIPKSFQFSIIFSFIFGLLIIFNKTHLSCLDLYLLLVALFSFIITPASSPPGNPSVVVWRFGLVFLFLQFIYFIAIFEPLGYQAIQLITKSRWSTFFISILILFTSIIFFHAYDEVLIRKPSHAKKIENYYSISNQNYQSVFDYIDHNIHNSIVWIEGAPHYYAYDDEFSNTVSRSEMAHFIVLVDKSPDEMWFDINKWPIVYQDSRGSIYKNPKKH